MPSRAEMSGAATVYARELGWTDIEAIEMDGPGGKVMFLLNAPGASEQVVEAPLSKLRKALKDLGGPEIYSETEEYDLPAEESVAAGEEDQETVEAVAEGLGVTEDEARNQLAYVENDSTWVDEATEPQYDEEWAERDDYGAPTVKELHRALEGVGDTGPDGIPRPEQLIPEEEDLMPGGKIVARRGEEVMQFGFAVRPQVKAALEERGWSFTHIVAAARGDSTVAIEPSGRVTIQNVNGRLFKSAGGLLHVEKAGRSFVAKSVSVDYARAGWHIS